MKGKEHISSKEYIKNYQKALNNYTKSIKFYSNNIKIIETIEKIISQYKENILVFQKNLTLIKKNLIKPLFEEEQKNYGFSIYNKYIEYIDNFFTFQIDSMSNIINELGKKCFVEEENNKSNQIYINPNYIYF